MASIFVQIPAYHDIELEKTINSIYSSCSGENIINVGVHFNYYDNIPTVIDKCFSAKYQYGDVRSVTNKAPDGLGASLSRYIANSLYQGEDYYLQLDSHMKLRKNWDKTTIEDFEYLKIQYDSKIAISTYPGAYTYTKTGDAEVNYAQWKNTIPNSNVIEINDINWIANILDMKINPKPDKCDTRNATDNRHNNVSGAFIFSSGEINSIYTKLPNVIIEETILSMKLVSMGFNVVGALREVALHLGPHPYMLTLNNFNNEHDEMYEKLLSEYPRRLARIDFAHLYPVSRDIDIVKNQLIGDPEEKYILFNGMSLNDYLELSDLEICS